jgi:hypothetical protein
MARLFAIAFTLEVIAVFLLTYAATQYVEQGFGLHPLIALTLASVIAFLAGFGWHILEE